MLGEKRSSSLFTPQAPEPPATHTVTQPDGGEVEMPLYFGSEYPVMETPAPVAQGEAGEPLPETPMEAVRTAAEDPRPDHPPRRSLTAEAVGQRAHSLFFTPESEIGRAHV